MRIVVINASLSESSTAASLGRRALESLELLTERKEFSLLETQWIDLRPHAHALVDALLSGFPSPPIEEFFVQLRNADAVVALTPVYQASYSGLFKLFCDILPDGILRGLPVLLGATGGTARHGLVIDHALRPLFAYLGAIPTATSVYAATQDWGDPGLERGVAEDEPLQHRIDKACLELWKMVSSQETPQKSLVPALAEPPVSAPYPGFIDFETLLQQKGQRGDFPLEELRQHEHDHRGRSQNEHRQVE